VGWESRPTRLERLAAPLAGEATRPHFRKKSFTCDLERSAGDVEVVRGRVGPGPGDLVAESVPAVHQANVVGPAIGTVGPRLDPDEDHVPFGRQGQMAEVGDGVLGMQRDDMESQRRGGAVDPEEGGRRVVSMQDEIGEWDEEFGCGQHGTTFRDEGRPRAHAARGFQCAEGV